ncbi:MAG TPA: c-type cytochrome [Phnomibacter sp.]|nr:c-type cytochrome [Phnomibacter sp.]
MKINWKQNWPLYTIAGAVTLVVGTEYSKETKSASSATAKPAADTAVWTGPSLYADGSDGFDRDLLIYGHDIITNTALYFGPNGKVAQITNGMNCQNCHLQAGTKAWGNNYGAVYSTYPKYRDRSGTIETIPKRVNDCFERSLNGKALDTTSREMQAIVAYISWLGKGVAKGQKPKGSGITELPYLDRPASPERGKAVYIAQCQSCHGVNGEGTPDGNNIGYAYPPLWGPNSYNSGAGLFRLSRFAGYVMDNMPFNKATHENAALTVEDAWDVAAFVNAQPRPSKDLSADWPDISKKPVDHPFGPFADGFSEEQHKFGPFGPIVAARKSKK